MPEAPTATATGSESTPTAGSPAPAASAPAPAAPDRQEQLRRTEEGRLRAELKTVQSQLKEAADTIGELKKWRDEREQAEYQAYLESLPPTERIQVELQDTKDQLKTLKEDAAARKEPPPPVVEPSPPAQRQLTDAEKADLIRQKKAEIAKAVSTELGLEGDFAIDPEDETLDATTPDSFAISARTLGRLLQEGQKKAGGAAAPNTQEAPLANKSGDEPITLSQRELDERINSKVSELLGVGGTLSAEASGGVTTRASGGPTSEDFQKVGRAYDSRQGPAAGRRELLALKSKAEQALSAAGRG